MCFVMGLIAALNTKINKKWQSSKKKIYPHRYFYLTLFIRPNKAEKSRLSKILEKRIFSCIISVYCFFLLMFCFLLFPYIAYRFYFYIKINIRKLCTNRKTMKLKLRRKEKVKQKQENEQNRRTNIENALAKFYLIPFMALRIILFQFKFIKYRTYKQYCTRIFPYRIAPHSPCNGNGQYKMVLAISHLQIQQMKHLKIYKNNKTTLEFNYIFAIVLFVRFFARFFGFFGFFPLVCWGVVAGQGQI